MGTEPTNPGNAIIENETYFSEAVKGAETPEIAFLKVRGNERERERESEK